ncbi:MAG: transporter permease [Streptosporangiaceae bacterium]|jgi:ABC-type uncharacterized transport system permease subunit|nr:transporter permease [Streptosporangiaceae bacterium]
MREQMALVARAGAMVVLALLVATAIFTFAGYRAGDIFSGALQGAVTAPGAWQNTARWAVPLLLIGLGVVVSFRAGYFNVGAQGQLYLGAIAAYLAAHACPGPGWLAALAALVAGMLGGAAWALIAAVLRVALGTDETLSTLMLNFIGVLVLRYAVNGPLRDPTGSGQVAATPEVPPGSRLSDASGISWWIALIVLIAGAMTWVMVNRTRFGLVTTLAGRNPEMVRWQGVRSSGVALGAFALAGALAGLAGAVEVLGPAGRVINGFSPNLGFTAVLVALVGILTVSGAMLAAVFFGALAAAVQFLPVMTELPASAFDLLQAIVAVTITAQLRRPRWLATWRLRRPARLAGGSTRTEAA